MRPNASTRTSDREESDDENCALMKDADKGRADTSETWINNSNTDLRTLSRRSVLTKVDNTSWNICSICQNRFPKKRHHTKMCRNASTQTSDCSLSRSLDASTSRKSRAVRFAKRKYIRKRPLPKITKCSPNQSRIALNASQSGVGLKSPSNDDIDHVEDARPSCSPKPTNQNQSETGTGQKGKKRKCLCLMIGSDVKTEPDAEQGT